METKIAIGTNTTTARGKLLSKPLLFRTSDGGGSAGRSNSVYLYDTHLADSKLKIKRYICSGRVCIVFVYT